MTASLAISAVSQSSGLDFHDFSSQSMPTQAQTHNFQQSMTSAQEAGPTTGADLYVKSQSVTGAAAPGGAAMSMVGQVGTEASKGFAKSTSDVFGKLNNLDLTDPASMVTMMEVQLGVMGAGVQMGFITKVADNAVHDITTLIKNQG